MINSPKDPLSLVLDYHERTKHHFQRYAASLGYMDWANQPNPFRVFAGAPRIELEHPALRAEPSYDALFAKHPTAAPFDRESISRLFYHSLALSAWKRVGDSTPWSLRINPSSGALHPTEGYLVCGAFPGLADSPGVFHYAPHGHGLERRCKLSDDDWSRLTEALPQPCVLMGLTSIYWREAWKYGERALRYCHHDVGHAIGTIVFAARTLGWQAHLISSVADNDLNQLVGTHLQHGPEAEHADCLLVLYPAETSSIHPRLKIRFTEELRRGLATREFVASPNQLSKEHHPWPAIDEAAQACRLATAPHWESPQAPSQAKSPSTTALKDRGSSAEQIIRQRRSAVDMDGKTTMGRHTFFETLRRSMPASGRFPFDVLPWAPQVSLAIFVHRVVGLDPGVYLLLRDPSHETSLRELVRKDSAWAKPAGCPEDLPLYLMAAEDVRRAAKAISCGQEIAADGVFSMGMLARFEPSLRQFGPAFYPRLFWETGLIGQLFYLEAEAAGVRATGIGCFFDDSMHDLLGLKDHSWQSLYHFTVGGAVEDERLTTIPPYQHLRKPSL